MPIKHTESQKKIVSVGGRQKVAISERALIQRINRALAREDRVLKKTRARRDGPGIPQVLLELGDYWILDVSRNAIDATKLDIDDVQDLGRELGVMRPWETVADE